MALDAVVEPLVTIVIPAYNAARFVLQAIDSVLAQTHRAIEVVVVDDGSTDGTAEVVRRVTDPRVHLIRTANSGVGAARNTGWCAGRGELVAFLDADDRWLPTKLEEQLAYLAVHDHIGLVGSLMRYESPGGRPLGFTGTPLDRPEEWEAVRAAELMPFPISSVVARRPVLLETGGFDESLHHTIPGLVEDLDFVARAADVTGVACVPRVLGVYRIHPGAATAQHFASQRMGTRFVRERLRARRSGGDLDWETFRHRYSPSLRQTWGDVVASAYRRAGLAAAEGRWFGAARWAAAAVLLGPGYSLRRALRQRPWVAMGSGGRGA